VSFWLVAPPTYANILVQVGVKFTPLLFSVQFERHRLRVAATYLCMTHWYLLGLTSTPNFRRAAVYGGCVPA